MDELMKHINRLEEIFNKGGRYMLDDLGEWLRIDLPRVKSLAENAQMEMIEMSEEMQRVFNHELEKAAERVVA